MSSKIYRFFNGHQANQYKGVSPELIGNKAHNLIEIVSIGYASVPPGLVIPSTHTFTIPEEGWGYQHDHIIRTLGAIRELAETQSLAWGNDPNPPMLVSCRSGSKTSMPGMMDTVLNLGLSNQNIETLSAKTSPEFAYDCYRRLIESYAKAVDGLPTEPFQEIREAAEGFFVTLDEASLHKIVDRYLAKYTELMGRDFPESPDDQVINAINAVYRSWNSERAQAYRKIENIDDSLGTAVTIQQMKFGNLNSNSCTGVLFTVNPQTGDSEAYGDFIIQGQGEDVVSGACATRPISEMESVFPQIHKDLIYRAKRLEKYFGYPLDIEFTVENGTLWILQVRQAKCAPVVEVQGVLKKHKTGKLNLTDATSLIQSLLSKKSLVNDDSAGETIGTGTGIVPGVIEGVAALTEEEVARLKESGTPYIFFARETSPEHTKIMSEAAGIVTENGGVVSHAAIVARAWDVVTVVGCGPILKNITPGESYIIDGTAGQIKKKG